MRIASFLPILLVLLAAPLAAQPAAEIEIGFMNGLYTDLDQGIAPVRRGGMTIHVSSPEHRLTVHGNRLRLAGTEDDTVEALLEVDFEGEGKIVAELESGAARQRFDDQVAAPRQTVTVTGEARLEKVEDGYLMTVVGGDETVELVIHSGMGDRLVGLCRLFERLPFIPINCAGIETALSVVTVPLPRPGEQFLVPAEQLTAEEKAFFDRYSR